MHGSLVRMIIGDPSPIVLSGIKAMCAIDKGIEITSAHLRMDGIRHAVSRERPTIVLMDWHLIVWQDTHPKNAFDWLSLHCPFAFLTMDEKRPNHQLASVLGAKGVISKRSSAEQLRRAIWMVARGGVWKTAKPILSHERNHPVSLSVDEEIRRIGTVTPREREVMLLLCKGKRNKQIASELRISESTVTHHLTSLFAKLQVADRLELATFAHRHANLFAEESRIESGYQAHSEQEFTPHEALEVSGLECEV